MVWDLGKAMQKKEEFESARLMDFEFRLRIRATRLFAQKLCVDEAALVGEITLSGEEHLLDMVAKQAALSKNDVALVYGQCVGEARQKLIAERGDPTPNRLV